MDMKPDHPSFDLQSRHLSFEVSVPNVQRDLDGIAFGGTTMASETTSAMPTGWLDRIHREVARNDQRARTQ